MAGERTLGNTNRTKRTAPINYSELPGRPAVAKPTPGLSNLISENRTTKISAVENRHFIFVHASLLRTMRKLLRGQYKISQQKGGAL